MKRWVMFGVIVFGLLGLSACSSAPPKLQVHVDTTKCPYFKYQCDHAACLEKARALHPVTEMQLRRRPAIYRPVYIAQKAYVISCLQGKGYRVIKDGELVPF